MDIRGIKDIKGDVKFHDVDYGFSEGSTTVFWAVRRDEFGSLSNFEILPVEFMNYWELEALIDEIRVARSHIEYHRYYDLENAIIRPGMWLTEEYKRQIELLKLVECKISEYLDDSKYVAPETEYITKEEMNKKVEEESEPWSRDKAIAGIKKFAERKEESEPGTKDTEIAGIQKFAERVESEKVIQEEERRFLKKWGAIPSTSKFQLYTDEQIAAYQKKELARDIPEGDENSQRIADSLAADPYVNLDWEVDFEESKNIEQDPGWKPEEKARKELVKRMKSDVEWEAKVETRQVAREYYEKHFKKEYPKIMAQREIDNLNWSPDYHISFHPPLGKPYPQIGVQPPRPWEEPPDTPFSGYHNADPPRKIPPTPPLHLPLGCFK